MESGFFQWKLDHIDMLEMEAVFKTCMHSVSHLQGKVVRVRCDVHRQGRQHEISMLAWKLLKWTQSH